jgi:thiaminase/transcriptional activator TenA
LGVGKNGDNLDIFSCLSVCIIGYGEIGFKLSKIKNWKKSKYASWIKMYSSKEYQQVCRENIVYLDILLKNSKGKKLTTIKKNFKKSTILERNFWQCFV